MQKIIYITNYKGSCAGDIDSVSNAEAHSLIEKGVAILHRHTMEDIVMDRMLVPQTKIKRKRRIKKGYNTK